MGRAELHFFSNADELANAVAVKWLAEIESANRAGRIQNVALSGGRIAQKFFSATVELAKIRKNLFNNVHFFWADERCVSPNDSESNFRVADEILFKPLQINGNQIHRFRGEDLPEQAVKIAEMELAKFAKKENGVPAFDLIFLGMGEDGHIASLFQNAMSRCAECNDFLLFIEDSPKSPQLRLTLNFNVIAAAAQVWVLASGDGKEFALKQSLIEKGQTPLAKVIQLRAATKIFTEIKI